MSLIGVGVECGFTEIGDGCIVVYPKRAFSSSMLKDVIEEIKKDGYDAPDGINFSQPIVFKKKERIDMTEVIVKLFSLSASYGVNLKVQTFAEAGNVEIHFTYKGVSVTKSFDIEMLCAMEHDYLTDWFEMRLQEIDEAGEKKND